MRMGKVENIQSNIEKRLRPDFSTRDVVDVIRDEGLSIDEAINLLRNLGYNAYLGGPSGSINVSTERFIGNTHPLTPAHGTSIEIQYEPGKHEANLREPE